MVSPNEYNEYVSPNNPCSDHIRMIDLSPINKATKLVGHYSMKIPFICYLRQCDTLFAHFSGKYGLMKLPVG